jgi:hypothetical protein
LLSTNVLFPEEVFPPFLAFLLKIPLLEIVNERYVIVLIGTNGGGNLIELLPEMWFFGRFLPTNSHDQQRIVDDI